MKLDVLDFLNLFMVGLCVVALCAGCYCIGYRSGADHGEAHILKTYKCENLK